MRALVELKVVIYALTKMGEICGFMIFITYQKVVLLLGKQGVWFVDIVP